MEMEKEMEKEKENSSIAAIDINNSNGEAVNESAAAADFSFFSKGWEKASYLEPKQFFGSAITILIDSQSNANGQLD